MQAKIKARRQKYEYDVSLNFKLQDDVHIVMKAYLDDFSK